MCGIVGVFSYKENIESQRSFIDWSLHTMNHRGPDSNGVWSNDQNYIAGFVRLSIRDLTVNGNQPMLSSCGFYSISFNGEIYNTHLFKQRLEKEGVRFSSTTDTEVLLYALVKWGEQYVLENFDGIFAFAFYDQHKDRLILARDRSGVKPLYIGQTSHCLIYSSQYDHIINHQYIKNNSIDTGALGAYLSLGYVPEGTGIMASTFLLPHGYYVEVTNTGYVQHRYYNYSLHQLSPGSFHLEQVLEESVKSQLVSDVPVGTFMSGGVDSPLVSYYAKKHTQLQSFTIGVDDAAMDESRAAEEYASTFGLIHNCKHITEADLLATINDSTKAFTEPFADFSSIPTLLLSKFARQHVTVALSGDGGDELFWGYPRNARMMREGMLFRQNKLSRVFNYAKEKISGGKREYRKRHLLVDDFPAYYYRSLFIYGAEVWLPNLFDGTSEAAFYFNEFYKENNALELTEENVMNTVRKLEFDLHLQRILLKVDRASMYHSLEVRVPMLSNAMIQYSNTLSHSECIVQGQGKYNLKQLLINKSRKELVLQPKKGFVIPINDWLRKELRRDVEDKLNNMPGELQVFFNKKELSKIISQHMSSKGDWGWLIWSIYSLVNWYTQHTHAKTTAAHLHNYSRVSGTY